MKNVTRAEHLAWCKQRAHQEYEFYKIRNPEGALHNAAVSMLSDLGKHPETQKLGESCAMLIFTVRDETSLFKFIDGFN
jgi:hypothetical protein